MKFGSILPAVLGGVLLAGTAMAADLPVRPVPLPVPAFTWTGFYSGIELGGISTEFRRPFSFTPAFNDGVGAIPAAILPIGGSGHRDRDSALAGTRGGYLHQFGMFVIGIEGGTQVFSLTQRRSSLATFTTPALLAPFANTDQTAIHQGWQSTVRGRLGVAWDRFMLYATGGVAFTTVRVDSQFATLGTRIGGSFTKDKSMSGYTIGVGGEWAITDATSIGVEYRHTEYDRENTVTGSFAFPTGIVPISTRVDLSNDAVMLTYNVRFGRIFPQFDWRL